MENEVMEAMETAEETMVEPVVESNGTVGTIIKVASGAVIAATGVILGRFLKKRRDAKKAKKEAEVQPVVEVVTEEK